MNNKEILERLYRFRDIVSESEHATNAENISELRSEYNRLRPLIEAVIKKANTMSYFAVSYPLVDGGNTKKNLIPLDYVFNDIYGITATSTVIDIIDQTIGAYEMNVNMNDNEPKYSNTQVFIVHGRDEGMQQAVERVIEKLNLEPIILSEQVNNGKTIIEKFEKYSDVGYAVVLLSPCDEGRLKNTKDELEPRARQNVILELGYFIGKLKRERVSIIRKTEVKEPSDITGLGYIDYDSNEGWKYKLADELKAAGYKVSKDDL